MIFNYMNAFSWYSLVIGNKRKGINDLKEKYMLIESMTVKVQYSARRITRILIIKMASNCIKAEVD